MKKYIWLLIGILSVSVFYFCMIFISDDYWLHGEATVIFTGLLILIFILYITREPFPVKVKNIIIIIYFVTACLLSVPWVQSKSLVFMQKEYMISLREKIDDGQIRDIVYSYSLETLYKYNLQNKDTVTIENIFEQVVNDSTYPGFNDEVEILNRDSMKLYISSNTGDEVIIIGEGAVNGFDEKFPNLSGRIGYMQYTCTVNKDGIKYVRNN